MPESVDAILMAAGFSRRFGSANKLMQPFLGKRMAEHVLHLFAGLSLIESVFFIFSDQKVGTLADDYPSITKIHNTNPERGGCESVRLGVSASQADYYLFVHCDQPLLNAETVARILALRCSGKIVMPSHKGMPRTPVLFSSSFRQELLELADHENPRIIKNKYPDRVIDLDVPTWPLLEDIDTREKLIFLESIIKNKDM